MFRDVLRDMLVTRVGQSQCNFPHFPLTTMHHSSCSGCACRHCARCGNALEFMRRHGSYQTLGNSLACWVICLCLVLQYGRFLKSSECSQSFTPLSKQFSCPPYVLVLRHPRVSVPLALCIADDRWRKSTHCKR